MKRKSKGDTWNTYQSKSREIYGTVNISRKQAVENGLVFYKGAACEKGHDGYRYTSNRDCRLCSLAAPYDNSVAIEQGKIRKRIQDRLEALSTKDEYDYL